MTLVEQFVDKVSEFVEKRTKETTDSIKQSALEEFDTVVDLLLEVGVSRQEQLDTFQQTVEDNQQLFDKMSEKIDDAFNDEETTDDGKESEGDEEQDEKNEILEQIDNTEQTLTTVNLTSADMLNDSIQGSIDNLVKSLNKNGEIEKKNAADFKETLTTKETNDKKRAAKTDKSIKKFESRWKENASKAKKWIRTILVVGLLIYFRQVIEYLFKNLMKRMFGDDWFNKFDSWLATNLPDVHTFLHTMKDFLDKFNEIYDKYIGYKQSFIYGTNGMGNRGEFKSGEFLSTEDVARLKDSNLHKGSRGWTDDELWILSKFQDEDKHYIDPNTGVDLHADVDAIKGIRRHTTWTDPIWTNLIPGTLGNAVRSNWSWDAVDYPGIGYSTVDKMYPTEDERLKAKLYNGEELSEEEQKKLGVKPDPFNVLTTPHYIDANTGQKIIPWSEQKPGFSHPGTMLSTQPFPNPPGFPESTFPDYNQNPWEQNNQTQETAPTIINQVNSTVINRNYNNQQGSRTQ